MIIIKDGQIAFTLNALRSTSYNLPVSPETLLTPYGLIIPILNESRSLVYILQRRAAKLPMPEWFTYDGAARGLLLTPTGDLHSLEIDKDGIIDQVPFTGQVEMVGYDTATYETCWAVYQFYCEAKGESLDALDIYEVAVDAVRVKPLDMELFDLQAVKDWTREMLDPEVTEKPVFPAPLRKRKVT